MPDEEEPIISQWEQHEGDEEWRELGDITYEDMLDDMISRFGEDVMDQHAADLMYDVWFNADETSFDRAWDLFEFFDYTGLAYEDFDWDIWREWYEN